MDARRSAVTVLFFVCAVALAPVRPALAQVCGDSDGNGMVDLADGVIALRAAAQLPDPCPLNVCDVDGDGSVTLADGVLILRKSAELPITENCPGGGTGDVQALIDPILPFLTFGIDLLLTASPTAEPAGGTEDCPAGGTRTKEQGVNTVITLDACRFSDAQLGSFEFNGTITANIPSATVSFNFTTEDLISGVVVQFNGSVQGSPTGGGGFVVDGGPVTLTTPQGNFTLNFENFTVNGEGDPISGTGTIADTSDNFELDSIQVTGTGTVNADLLATFDNGDTATFLLNLQTGELTPTS